MLWNKSQDSISSNENIREVGKVAPNIIQRNLKAHAPNEK